MKTSKEAAADLQKVIAPAVAKFAPPEDPEELQAAIEHGNKLLDRAADPE